MLAAKNAYRIVEAVKSAAISPYEPWGGNYKSVKQKISFVEIYVRSRLWFCVPKIAIYFPLM